MRRGIGHSFGFTIPTPILLIGYGFAFRSCGLPDGRRAILHMVTPGDFAGLDHVVLHRPIEDITAATAHRNVDRQVVIIRDLNRLREFAHGGPLSYPSWSCRKTRWRTYQPARKRGWVARERALRPHAVR